MTGTLLSTGSGTDIQKVLQMDRRGHALQGMDRVYTHVTLQMRQRLCESLEGLWQDAVAQREAVHPQSAVALLDEILRTQQMGNQAL